MKYQLPETESGKDVWQLAREISLSAGEILLDWWPKAKEISDQGPVSYTHLTLPTICSV